MQQFNLIQFLTENWQLVIAILGLLAAQSPPGSLLHKLLEILKLVKPVTPPGPTPTPTPTIDPNVPTPQPPIPTPQPHDRPIIDAIIRILPTILPVIIPLMASEAEKQVRASRSVKPDTE